MRVYVCLNTANDERNEETSETVIPIHKLGTVFDHWITDCIRHLLIKKKAEQDKP